MPHREEIEHEGDEWVIGTWHVYYGVELHALVDRDGRPWAEGWPGADVFRWYRWRSYHAARKFQRSHPQLEGYVIVNLSALQRQCRERKERDEARRKGGS